MIYDDLDPVILRNLAIHTLPIDITYFLKTKEKFWWLCFKVRGNLVVENEEDMD